MVRLLDDAPGEAQPAFDAGLRGEGPCFEKSRAPQPFVQALGVAGHCDFSLCRLAKGEWTSGAALWRALRDAGRGTNTMPGIAR